MEVITEGTEIPKRDRIFIVEDEKIVADDLKIHLESNGYEVVGIASSGHDAISQIKSLSPDLVLMDVRIEGDLNGIEVAIIIQSLFEHQIPVVFLTGFSEEGFPYVKVIRDYIYINKPYSETNLLNSIQRALGRNKTAPE